MIVIMLSILVILICTLPVVQRVEKTVQGISFVNEEAQDGTVTITIDGFKRNYLFRKDKLDVAITISDSEADIQTLGPIFPEHEGVYFTTTAWYDPIENSYHGGYLAFNKDLSVLIITGIKESIYVASSNADANLEELFRIYGPFFAETTQSGGQGNS